MRPLEILVGDARARLLDVPAGSIQSVVSSPPYFGLRNYGAEGQIGLEPSPAEYVEALVEVFRLVRRALRPDGTVWLNLGDSYAGSWGGAARGAGPGPRSTLSGNGHSGGGPKLEALAASARGRVTAEREGWRNDIVNHSKLARSRSDFGGAKPKDLLMIPATVALALRADGWFLRRDIIWAKLNPMPESVMDRPTASHEHVFLLAASERYFYDAQAIAEPATGLEDANGFRGGAYVDGEAFDNGGAGGRRKRSGNVRRVYGEGRDRPGSHMGASIPWEGMTRNARDVWSLASEPCGDQLCQACGRYYAGAELARLPKRQVDGRPVSVCRCGSTDGWLAHFATMPATLAERCIRAGTSEVGGCAECGAAWRRVIARGKADPAWQRACGGDAAGEYAGQTRKPAADGVQSASDLKRRILAGLGAKRQVGWAPSCSCATDRAPVPQRVLDPFGGAGTTGLAARRLQRFCTLVELHQGYARLAQHRVAADAPLLEVAS